MDAANLLGTADALVLSTICAHLDPPGLQAVARVLRAIGTLASSELQRQAIEMMRDDDPDLREDGRLMLRRLGAKSRAAIAPAVVQLFSHPHGCVRRDALLALTMLVDAADLPAYSPALLHMLGDANVEICETTLSALKLMDGAALAAHADAVLAAHEAWGDVDELDSREGVHAMQLLELAVSLNPTGLADRALDVLLQAIHEDKDVRQAARGVLAKFDASTRNSLRPLLTELFHEHDDGSEILEDILRAFNLLEGDELAATAPLLVSVASDGSYTISIRKEALSVLEHMPPKVLVLLAPALLPLLKCGGLSMTLAFAAASVVGRMPDDGLAEYGPAIMALLFECDTSERELLLCAFQALGPRALEAIAPALVQTALDYCAPRIRHVILGLLALLSPEALCPHAPFFFALLRDDTSCVRGAAMHALRKMGLGMRTEGWERHLSLLLATLDEAEGDARADVVWAFEDVVSSSELAHHSHLLVGLATGRDACVRASALHIMSTLNPADLAPHADMIVRALRSHSEHERWCALEASKVLGLYLGAPLERYVTKLLLSPESKQQEVLGIRYIRISKQHERNPHGCRAAAAVARCITTSTTEPVRAKRRVRRWLV
jgi:hypothetical protein